uniref:Uncharacterized protein n=1 Tax=Strombidinopsis acuminata TaxID=141414 RepID=A0A7S3RLM6_9SPIT|mmetsp:Transcript_113234/g.156420  ORF Transcript_113234/g.156420 Transcript_113234/m.156420 type:complete len:164 (+) Transcript_113234:166-657(+)
MASGSSCARAAKSTRASWRGPQNLGARVENRARLALLHEPQKLGRSGGRSGRHLWPHERQEDRGAGPASVLRCRLYYEKGTEKEEEQRIVNVAPSLDGPARSGLLAPARERGDDYAKGAARNSFALRVRRTQPGTYLWNATSSPATAAMMTRNRAVQTAGLHF